MGCVQHESVSYWFSADGSGKSARAWLKISVRISAGMRLKRGDESCGFGATVTRREYRGSSGTSEAESESES